MKLTHATPEQFTAIRDLVNQAYRGQKGWTTEHDLLSGDRTQLAEIEQYHMDPRAHLLVVSIQRKLRACVCIEDRDVAALIGYLAVHPDWQGQGLGKTVLTLAERYCKTVLKKHKSMMLVVSQRPELIAYYVRRGYVHTGKVEPFPVHRDVGSPRVQGLTVEYLEKLLA